MHSAKLKTSREQIQCAIPVQYESHSNPHSVRRGERMIEASSVGLFSSKGTYSIRGKIRIIILDLTPSLPSVREEPALPLYTPYLPKPSRRGATCPVSLCTLVHSSTLSHHNIVRHHEWLATDNAMSRQEIRCLLAIIETSRYEI